MVWIAGLLQATIDFGMPAWKPVIKIDYLFAYPQKGWRVISTQTVQSLLSDHLPIITELEYVKEASKKKIFDTHL